jgi:hypothetical protein
MARPTKRTPETEAAILDALRAGNTRTDAALIAGLNPHTLSDWCKRFPQFSAAVEKAEAEARARMVAIVAKAAVHTWTAAAWYLERRDPEHFGRRDRLDMTLDARREAERIAAEDGLDPSEVLAEAEAILARAR